MTSVPQASFLDLEFSPGIRFIGVDDKILADILSENPGYIKITMTKGTAVEYEWTTSSGDAFYDLHGDSSSVNYHIYKKGTSAAEQGTLTAEFDGNHGWYWKNRSSEAITITLKATGAYQDIKEMK